jgi:multiple sugar transport system permease protein
MAGARKPFGDNVSAHVFLLPWFIGLALFIVGPTLVSLYLSFTDYDLLDPPHDRIGLF